MKTRPYLIEFSLAILAYAVVTAVSLKLLRGGVDSPVWQALLTLSPLLPLIAVCISVLRHIRRIDEMQRLITFEALAIAFASTAVTTMGYGFLENIGWLRLSMFVVLPLMAALTGLSLLLTTWRYK
ncbi:MAG: hypothetical protein CSA68_10585 [Rhodobacterales bacterium]|nr:MAG: hypothetical protein CSA68_10585 [Rhodobacterales bacterium]